MKLLLLACLVVLASADDFLKESDSSIDESILAFLQGVVRAGSLTQKMGIDNSEIEQMADDLEFELGKVLRESLRNILDRIRDHVENGKEVGQELFDKVKEIKGKLKDLRMEEGERLKETLRIIKQKGKEALRKILERLGLGKRNMDDLMDHVARMKFKELVDKMREKILSNKTIQRIRDYIENHYGESSLVKKLKKLVKNLKDGDIRDILDSLLDYRPGQEQSSLRLRNEAWDKIKHFFKDLDIRIQEHTKKFGEWARDVWGKGMDKLRDKYGAIKAIAMEFVANSKDVSAERTRDSLEFFRPYSEDMGSLWNKLRVVAKEAIGRF